MQKCGDIMRIYLDIDDNQIIRDCKFKTFGCGAAVATSSMATRTGKRKNYSGSPPGDQQSGDGSSGWPASGKSPLFPCWQKKLSMRLCGIIAEKNGIKIEGLSKPKSDIHEGEEEEEEDY